jgi:hypothetical protein
MLLLKTFLNVEPGKLHQKGRSKWQSGCQTVKKTNFHSITGGLGILLAITTVPELMQRNTSFLNGYGCVRNVLAY